jgi:hypothetical protein
MKSRFKSVLAGAGALAIASGMLLATSGSALALQTPAYEPDSKATLGGVDFFNASGVQITSGPVTGAPFAAFAVAQTTPSTSTPLATLFGATPNSGKVTPVGAAFANTFSNEQMSDSTNYPISSATPADIHGITNPVVTGLSTDEDLATYITHIPNADTSTTDGYGNLYQMRVLVSGATGYAAASIQISGTGASATWTQVSGKFQLFADTTTTALVVTPASPSVPLTVQHLTATVTDTTTGTTVPAGTVQFLDGTTAIGAPVALTGGVATTTTTLALGSHPLTAVFTSSAPSAVAGSTSAISTYVVANLDASNTALSVNPLTAAAFTPVALSATVTDTTVPATVPTGSVQFFDGATPIGSPVALVAGVANLNDTAGFTFSAPGPTHSITAQYLGSAAINGSTSAAVTFTATAPACPNGESSNLCTDPQTVEATVAAGTITITTPYSPANPLNLGTFVLNSAGNLLSVSAPFGFTTSGTAGEIFVTDTRAGDPNWTASVQSGNFTSPASPSTPIDGQNAGLIGLTVEPVSGNALTAANVTVTNTPSGTAPIISGGTQGIGGAKHTFAQTTAGGDGSIGFIGTFTLNAPTSTGAGLYTGTVTFTVG